MKRKSAFQNPKKQYDTPPDAIYADPTPNNFTQVPNTVIEDPNLSWKSLGILVFLLRNKNKKGWHTYLSSVIQAKKDKKDSVSSGLTELELLGYVLRFRYYDEKKKVRGSFFAYTAHPFQFELKYITTWIKKKKWGFTPSTQISKDVYQQMHKKLNRPNLKMGNPILGKPILENPPLKRKILQKEKSFPKKENNKINKFDPMEVFMEICPKEMKLERIFNTIKEYVLYRLEQGNPIKTKQAMVILVNKLRNFSEEEIVEALERSIMNSWIGVFPRKKEDYGYAGPDKQYHQNKQNEPEDEYDGLRKPENKSWKDMQD